MPQIHEIRADYDDTTLIVYQADSAAIAEAALRASTFVAPFSLDDGAQSLGLEGGAGANPGCSCHTHRLGGGLVAGRSDTPGEKRLPECGRVAAAVGQSLVNVQWDPERGLRGTPQDHRSIQLGISRHLIDKYVDEWTTQIQDVTPLVRKLHGLIQSGHAAQAKRPIRLQKVVLKVATIV